MTLMRAPASLQTRVLALSLGLVVLVWLGAAVLTWIDARHELDELLDGHLAQAAAMLVVQQAEAGHLEDNHVADAPTLHKYAPRVAFQVFHEGRLTLRSANAGDAPFAPESAGFSTLRRPDGTDWRVFSARGAEPDVQVHVAEQLESRSEILWAVLRGALLPLLAALPVLALSMWWAVRKGLGPVRQLSQVISERQAHAIEPIKLADLPQELQPVLSSLNGLFARIEKLIASERRFTSDAAHELRTPIAAIRAQAQVAMGSGVDYAQREHALQATLAGCDRATRLVDQLLMLARLEASGAAANTFAIAVVGLDEVARRVVASLAPRALERSQTLELECVSPCAIEADPLLTSVLLRNLVDNAMRYSPDGARIMVLVATQGGSPTLQVQDNGPGMSATDRARLGERFFRVLGNPQTGSGLGWSIVRRIAGAFGATVEADASTRLGGLCVTVRWPAIGHVESGV